MCIPENERLELNKWRFGSDGLALFGAGQTVINLGWLISSKWGGIMAFYGGWNPYSIKTSSKKQPVSLFGCTSSYRYSLKSSYPSVDDASPKKFGLPA